MKMKIQKQIIPIILITCLAFSVFFLLSPPYSAENQRSDNPTQQKTETEIQNEINTEPTYAFHGFHVTILNVSESEYRDTPKNSTLEEISSRGYEIISIVPEDIEKYSYLKEGLKPGAPNGEFTRALEDEEKDNFFEKFYGKCFSYRGHNYVIDSFKN